MAKTPLFEQHKAAGGQIVDFAGWDLPVRYSGIAQEHQAVRKSAGIFDVSHMGQIMVSGEGSEEFLNYCCCNDLEKIQDNQAQYSALLNEQGGVIDDLIIYRLNQKKFLLCVNASNTSEAFHWLAKHNKNGLTINNVSEDFGLIALQGPKATEILSKIIPEITELKKFFFTEAYYKNLPIIIARTGYTGEDGFELFCPWDDTPLLWEALLEAGDKQLSLCGLGARDTLRLEASYPLHGHELRPDLPALSSGLNWIIKFAKQDFIGKAALQDLADNHEYDQLVGFHVMEPGLVRAKTILYDVDGTKVGEVTSGTKTPGFDKPIGMAIVKKDSSQLNTELFAEVRKRNIAIQLTEMPFYRRI